MTELARELAQELGADTPEALSRVEKMQFGDFDPNQAENYLKEQINQPGA